MANPALGTKRLCGGCATKFYDLGKDPIVCPSCDTVFVVPKPAPSRSRRPFEPQYQPAKAAPVAEAEAVAPAEKDSEEESEAGVPMLEEMDEE